MFAVHSGQTTKKPPSSAPISKKYFFRLFRDRPSRQLEDRILKTGGLKLFAASCRESSILKEVLAILIAR